MKIRSSYIWASLIALGVIGWFVSDNFTSSSDETDTEIAASDAPATEGAKAQADESVIPNLTISAMEVQNQDIDLQIRASGVTSTSFDMVITSRRKAAVTSINAAEGSWVKEGDVILQLDQGTLTADIDAARADRQAALAAYEDAKTKFGATGTLAAQLTAAEAELDAIEKNFNSTKQLVERGLQTDITLTNQRAQLRAAETRLFELQSLSKEKELSASYAALKRVDAEIARLEEQQSFTTIKAPQDGWLETIHLEKGEIASEGGAVAELLGLAKILLTVPVPQARINDVVIGDKVAIVINNQQDYQGQVQKIASDANPATRTFNVEIALDNKDGKLRSGMSAEAAIIIDDAKAYRISPAHLNVDADGQLTAKIANQAGFVETVHVTLERTEGNMAYVTGLQDGMIVLAAGQAFLSDGDKVTYSLEEGAQ